MKVNQLDGNPKKALIGLICIFTKHSKFKPNSDESSCICAIIRFNILPKVHTLQPHNIYLTLYTCRNVTIIDLFQLPERGWPP